MFSGHALTVLRHACPKRGHTAKTCRTRFVSVSVFDTRTRDMQGFLDESGFIAYNIVVMLLYNHHLSIIGKRDAEDQNEENTRGRVMLGKALALPVFR